MTAGSASPASPRTTFTGLVDAHVLADRLTDRDAALLASFGVTTVVCPVHDGLVDRAKGPTATEWLDALEGLLSVHGPRLRKAGLRPLFALGVHPSSAPERALDAVLHELPTFLSDPSVVALGTLGLNRDTPLERDAFVKQLEMAVSFRRPVFVSAPPLDPEKGPRLLSELVKAAGLPTARVLVGNVSAASVAVLRLIGFMVELEPSEGRLSEAECVHFVSRTGPGGFVLASHAGEAGSSSLAVPALLASMADAGLSEAVLSRVGRRNVLHFIGRADADDGSPVLAKPHGTGLA